MLKKRRKFLNYLQNTGSQCNVFLRSYGQPGYCIIKNSKVEELISSLGLKWIISMFKWALYQLCRSQKCSAWNRKLVQRLCHLFWRLSCREWNHGHLLSSPQGQEEERSSFSQEWRQKMRMKLSILSYLGLIKNVAFCSDEFVPRIWLLNQVWGS